MLKIKHFYEITDSYGRTIACGNDIKKRYIFQTFKDMQPDGNELLLMTTYYLFGRVIRKVIHFYRIADGKII